MHNILYPRGSSGAGVTHVRQSFYKHGASLKLTAKITNIDFGSHGGRFPLQRSVVFIEKQTTQQDRWPKLIIVPNAEVSDTTGDAISTSAGQQNVFGNNLNYPKNLQKKKSWYLLSV